MFTRNINFKNFITLLRSPRMIPKAIGFHWARALEKPVKMFNDIEVRKFESFSEYWSASRIMPTPSEINFFEYFCPKEGTIIDVGANIGLFAMYFCAQRPFAQVCAFEPHPKTFARLRENVQHNNLENVRVFQEALSNRCRRIKLLETQSSHMNRIDDLSGLSVESGVFIDVTTLDKFCTYMNVDEIAFLKVDVEGADVDVLLGGTTMFQERRVRAGLIEVSPLQYARYQKSVSQAVDLFRNYGYKLFYVSKGLEEIQDFSFLYDMPNDQLINLGFVRDEC